MINEVLQGDCLELLPLVPAQSVDLVLTDIPYAEVSRTSGGLRVLDKGRADAATFSLDQFVPAIARVARGSVYVFCGVKQISRLTELLQAQGMTTRLGIWQKTNPSPMNGTRLWLSGVEACVFGRFPNAVFNERCKSAIWTTPSGRSKQHPTEKPLALFQRLVSASTNEGDTVLDPCCGSGTTGVACQNTGRNFIQMELDFRYCKIARDRLKLSSPKKRKAA
jgi:site-specific DNA-methyltransferase (adenine-specific)